MVADVRFKVKMRLRALIETMVAELTTSQEARKRLALAYTSVVVAAEVKAQYRSRVVREFPGCAVTFTFNRLYIKLPDRYPAHNVPVSLPYPRELRGAFFPRAVEEFSK
jgi:hypothetical protein